MPHLERLWFVCSQLVVSMNCVLLYYIVIIRFRTYLNLCQYIWMLWCMIITAILCQVWNMLTVQHSPWTHPLDLCLVWTEHHLTLLMVCVPRGMSNGQWQWYVMLCRSLQCGLISHAIYSIMQWLCKRSCTIKQLVLWVHALPTPMWYRHAEGHMPLV